MSLFMDLAALCALHVEVKNGTNGHHLVACSVHVAFALHFVVTLPSYRSGSGIGYTSKQVDIIISKNQVLQI